MRAITVNEYGAAPALTEMPDPRPGSGQLLIKTEAAGMNPMDRTIANGGWKEAMPASFPLILGADLAGVIEAVGEGAGKFAARRRGVWPAADRSARHGRHVRGIRRGHRGRAASAPTEGP